MDNILQEAETIVNGARAQLYGDVTKNHRRIAQLWSVVLDQPVSAREAALCMLLVKVAREVHRPKRDNRVDMAGYAEVLDRISSPGETRELAGGETREKKEFHLICPHCQHHHVMDGDRVDVWKQSGKFWSYPCENPRCEEMIYREQTEPPKDIITGQNPGDLGKTSKI